MKAITDILQEGAMGLTYIVGLLVAFVAVAFIVSVLFTLFGAGSELVSGFF